MSFYEYTNLYKTYFKHLLIFIYKYITICFSLNSVDPLFLERSYLEYLTSIRISNYENVVSRSDENIVIYEKQHVVSFKPYQTDLYLKMILCTECSSIVYLQNRRNGPTYCNYQKMRTTIHNMNLMSDEVYTKYNDV